MEWEKGRGNSDRKPGRIFPLQERLSVDAQTEWLEVGGGLDWVNRWRPDRHFQISVTWLLHSYSESGSICLLCAGLE